MIEAAIVVALCLVVPPAGWKLQLVWRKWRHDRVLRRIAELEQSMGMASAEITSRPPDVRAGSLATPRGATAYSNYSQKFPMATVGELLGPPEPPKKKPERFVPVLDEDYFDARRYGVNEDRLNEFLAARKVSRKRGEPIVDYTPMAAFPYGSASVTYRIPTRPSDLTAMVTVGRETGSPSLLPLF